MSEFTKQVEEGLTAAIQGKWERTGDGWFNVPNCAKIVVKDAWGQVNIAETYAGAHQEANADLIANAPEWISKLLEERALLVEALKKEWLDARTWDGIGTMNQIRKALEEVGEGTP